MTAPGPLEREIEDPWAPLRGLTQARIGLGRVGTSLPTARVLELASAHAAARDAVHEPLDVAALLPQLPLPPGAGWAAHLPSRAADRAEYLRRPDLGRVPAGEQALRDAVARVRPDAGVDAAARVDVALVVADGLSPRAVREHAVGLLEAILDHLAPDLVVAAPIVATQARVALGDHVGEALGAETVLVIIGERPGLSVADSLGIYLTHHPRPGRTDAERNCVSNVHPPDGQTYAGAARTIAGLVAGARRLGRSGVDLKDGPHALPG
ncbi:ethanolamine ammonia-lyase subunit EutC [Nocardioides fonticola]|uniref:Ethanolamine ammonia-lyase small subunit n=1 Tax=Nocardioides fonticola TaxID=450363 RepID=A0ABP7X9Z2_9ACTN